MTSTVTDGVEALKPCPFCGDERAIALKGHGGLWRVKCAWAGDDPGCGAETRVHDTEAEAIAAWNTRPQPEGVEAMVERELPASMTGWARRDTAKRIADALARGKKKPEKCPVRPQRFDVEGSVYEGMAAAISNGTRTIAHCPEYDDALMIAAALSATNSEAVSELTSSADELARWYGPFNPTKHPPEINGAWLRLTDALAKLGSRAP